MGRQNNSKFLAELTKAKVKNKVVREALKRYYNDVISELDVPTNEEREKLIYEFIKGLQVIMHKLDTLPLK